MLLRRGGRTASSSQRREATRARECNATLRITLNAKVSHVYNAGMGLDFYETELGTGRDSDMRPAITRLNGKRRHGGVNV